MSVVTFLDIPKEIWWKIFIDYYGNEFSLLSIHKQIETISSTCDYWKSITTENKMFTQLLFKKHSSVFDDVKVNGEKGCPIDLQNYKMDQHETDIKMKEVFDFRKCDTECKIAPPPSSVLKLLYEHDDPPENNDIEERFQERTNEYNNVIEKDKTREIRESKRIDVKIKPKITITEEEIEKLLKQRDDLLFESIEHMCCPVEPYAYY